MKALRYLKALFLWSLWIIFHRFETRKQAEGLARNCPYYDPFANRVRVFAIQLDLEDEKFASLLRGKS
jgi:hypothetical protein